MKIKGNLRNKKKSRKIKDIHTQVLISQLLIAIEYQTLYHNAIKTHSLFSMVGYANCLFYTFMNINVNIRNKRTIAEKLNWGCRKFLISLFSIVLE